MKIGVIGSGNVGAALGKAWTKAGHQVIYGVRDPKAGKLKSLLSATGGTATAATVSEAAAQGEVVVLTTPWEATREAVQACGDLKGKIVFDCTNPVKPDLSGLSVDPTTSAGEQVASWAPGARVVKIFNTTGSNNMENSDYGGQAPAMFYAGDDAAAKEVAKKLAADIGFDPCDAGALTRARLLESLAMLWISLAFEQGWGREFAFNVIRR